MKHLNPLSRDITPVAMTKLCTDGGRISYTAWIQMDNCRWQIAHGFDTNEEAVEYALSVCQQMTVVMRKALSETMSGCYSVDRSKTVTMPV